MAEESIFIVDIGSSSVKAGYMGEDMPSYIFPSSLTQYQERLESIESWVGDAFASLGSALMSSHAIQRASIQSIEQFKDLWKIIRSECNLSNLDNTSIFLVESVRWTIADRTAVAAFLFDSEHVPSVCFGNSASLSVLASGRTTGLVVECGAGLTTAIPVFEGLVLRHAVTEMEYAGQDITAALRKQFIDKNINLDFNHAKTVKEKLAFARGYYSEQAEQTQRDSMTFWLPDGNEVTMDTTVFQACTDALFYNNRMPIGGLVPQVQESLLLCDESIKKELANNIILSGGSTMIPGFGDRLHTELITRLASDPDPRNQSLASVVRVVPNSNYREAGYTLQRKYAPWIGASLAASFETYHKCLKISRQEWEESHDEIVYLKGI